MFIQKFKRIEVQLSAGLSSTFFLENFKSVLKQQVSAVHDDEFHHGPGPQVSRSHSMDADICVLARGSDEEHIKNFEKPNRYGTLF